MTDEEDRPWEEEVEQRRDALPHRAGILVILGVFGLISAATGIGSLLGLPLSIATWMMASRDLKSMKAGTLDREGVRNTIAARELAWVGTMLGGAALAFLGFVIAVSLLAG